MGDFNPPALYISGMTVVIDRLAPSGKGAPPGPRDSSASPTGSGSRRRSRSEYAATRAIVRATHLHTVCEEAACPNIGECWTKAHATMMIMGDTCTRACAFCNVKTGLARRRWMPKSPPMSRRAVKKLGLTHVVITSVDRDDLADGGAEAFRRK